MSSGISTSSHDNNIFLYRRIALVNQSDHPLMRKVAKALVEKLSKIRSVESVRLIDDATDTRWDQEDGQILDDLYLILRMPQFKESGLLVTGRDIDAKINLNFGQRIGYSQSGYSSNFTPPFVRIRANMTLDHQSTSKGYESANAEYQCVVDGIAKEFANALSKAFGEWAGKYPALSSIPDELYPDYVPTLMDLPLPDHPSLKKVVSGRYLLSENRSAWTICAENPEVSQALFDQLHEDFKAAGWKISDYAKRKDEHTGNHLRVFGDGNTVYEAFEIRRDSKFKADLPVDMVIRYDDRLDNQQLTDVFEKLVAAEQLPMQSWLTFNQNIPRKLRDQITSTYLEQKHLPLDVELALIRYLKNHKRNEEALERLNQVAGLVIMLDSSNRSNMEKLGRELADDKKWKLPQVTEADFEYAGIQRLEEDKPLMQLTTLGQPVLVYAKVREKESDPPQFMLVNTRVDPSAIPEGIYMLSLTVSNGQGNITCSSTEHNPTSPWSGVQQAGNFGHQWIVNAQELEDGQFEMKIHYNKNP